MKSGISPRPFSPRFRERSTFFCLGRNIWTYYELRRNPMPNWASPCHSHRIIRLLGPPLLDDGCALFQPPSGPPRDPPRPPPRFPFASFPSLRGTDARSLCTSSRAVTNKSGFGNERLPRISWPPCSQRAFTLLNAAPLWARPARCCRCR